MAPRCMHRAALVASFTAVSMRIASSGSISMACGTRSTPLVPGIRMSHSMSAMRWRRSCCRASSPVPAAYTSYCCCMRNFLRAFRIGSSSSTTRIWTGPVTSATAVLLMDGGRMDGGRGSLDLHNLHQPPYPSLTCHEGDLHRPREQARPLGAGEQLGHGLSAGWAVVHRVRVYIHPDEPVDARWVQAAAVSRRVREGLGAVGEAVLNAGLEIPGDVPHQRVSQVAAHDVATERQRQARLVVPPFAEVDPEVQPAVGVGELPLVDEEPRVRAAHRHVLLDLIERYDDVARRRLVQLERQKRRGELARDRDEHAPRTERRARIGG